MSVETNILEAPWLVPVPIETNTKWEKFSSRFATRFFCLGRDWHYIDAEGNTCVIPGAFDDEGKLKAHYFVTDGKSYPRIVRPFFSAVGTGITEGLVHDFCYRYRCRVLADGTVIDSVMDRKKCDIQLRRIGISINGMAPVSWVAYWTLRAAGFAAWDYHRANDGTERNDISLLLKGFKPSNALSEKPVKNPFSELSLEGENNARS